MTGLLDTAILVDILRAYPAAAPWLYRQEHLGISPIVWLEVIEGAKNARDQARAVKLLLLFEKVEVFPLFTNNLKHFQLMIGNLAQKPY